MSDLQQNFSAGNARLRRAPATRPARPGTTVAKEDAAVDVLRDFLARHHRVAVLTGAGLSTASGIPDYRDDDGNWKHRRPVQYSDFMTQEPIRRRYWAQSFHGWQRIAGAVPNAAHAAITRLEHAGRICGIVTQNVDDLHRRAGSRNVVDLHGNLSRVRCLGCDARMLRAEFQAMLERFNPAWQATVTRIGPDGDSTLATDGFERFNVPSCSRCGGILKPDVVFFGESVPASRVARAAGIVTGADGLLIVGSSLMVFSGFRFARMAHAAGLPIGIVNRGITRADALADFRLSGDCATILASSVPANGP